MDVYRGSLELLDYVFYATVERGKVYETGGFIHNYALAYALGLVKSGTYTYTHLEQKPQYFEELTPLNGRVYITPGAPAQISFRLVQWNTLSERYVYPGKPPSLGFPDWGYARMLRPGSSFTFYLLLANSQTLPVSPALNDLLAGRTTRIRLGKFPAKARLKLKQADRLQIKRGSFISNALLNWRDLEVDPVVCDVVATSLPTGLVNRANFSGEEYYEAKFDHEVVCLPYRMHFLARINH